MRVVLLVPVVYLAGCGRPPGSFTARIQIPHEESPLTDDGFLTWMSGLSPGRPRGMAITDGTGVAAIGVAGFTATVDIASSSTLSDANAGRGPDMVVGVAEVDDVVLVLSVVDHGVGIVRVDEGGTLHWQPDGSTVLGARLTADGVVVARLSGPDGCSVTWSGPALSSTLDTVVPLPDAWCRDAHPIAISDDGAAWILGPGGVAVVSRSGEVHAAPVSGDLVAWDDEARVAYVAQTGEVRVTALAADAAIRWTADAEAPIFGLTAAGGDALISTGARHVSALVLLDGGDGRVRDRAEVGLDGGEVVASPDGHTIALISGGGWDLFESDRR
jgi:hypothetical protein